MQLFPATSFVIQFAWSFISAPHATNGQTHVGCDATCPPIGYEYDSSHLCPGSTLDDTSASKTYDVCYPQNYGTVSLSSFRQKGYVTVLSNVYTGCEAGRREAGVFAGLAQRIHEETGGNVVFVSSLKGGGDCSAWAEIYENDAAKMGLSTGESAWTMPLTVSDNSFELRDHFFTPPYPHPSYMILNENLEVTYKSVGPCCGYVSYYDCTDDIALELESILTNKIYEVYNEQLETSTTSTSAATTSTVAADTTTNASVEGMNESHFPLSCQSTTYSDWSECSLTCGNGGTQFRYRLNSVDPIETRPCPAEIVDTLSPCSEQCVPEFGPSTSTESFELSVIASGLDSPRDLAFHPTPGIHLGNYSEGRTFHPTEGEELWVVNGNNHSISIVASLGTEYQTTISRRDRGYYHYMNNVTALAFNEVKSSNRLEAQDTFNFFAVCNDNLNDYIGAKEPNFFMGPTLYDTDVVNKRGKMNTVNRHGADCSDPADQCFFLHADMLHESPACVGIAHDPELLTAYGAVYWAFDTTGDKSGNGGQLVRFDFSQPHGPGSMDHSIASVRRYPDIKLYRDDFAHSHAGMIVHPGKRILFISNPGKNGGEVTAVRIDTGRYSRTAREEYPIFSNRLPSFEYSIYECTEEYTFASGIQNPSGMALSLDGERLFVAERAGKILALEVDSGTVLQTIDVSPLGYTAIGGMAVSPTSGDLYFVDIDANEVVKVEASDGDCTYNSLSNLGYKSDIEFSQKEFSAKCGSSVPFSLTRDFSCSVSGIIPNGTLFEQVHTDGYASENPDVQSDAGMDASAALLANRTDCEYDSELNFDALLLGGYFCHVCLPQNHGSSCDDGGTCQNIQWQGFTCDNEFYVDYDDDSDSLVLSSLYYETTYSHENIIDLFRGTTYRFTVRTGDDRPVKITQNLDITGGNSISISRVQNPSSFEDVTTGPILVSVDETSPDFIYLTSGELKPVTFVVKHRDAENVEGLSDDYMPTTVLPSAGVYFSAHEAFVWVALLSLVGYAAIMD